MSKSEKYNPVGGGGEAWGGWRLIPLAVLMSGHPSSSVIPSSDLLGFLAAPRRPLERFWRVMDAFVRNAKVSMWCDAMQQEREKKERLSNFQRASLVPPSLQSDPASLGNNIQREGNCRPVGRPGSLNQSHSDGTQQRCFGKKQVWIRAQGPPDLLCGSN